MKEILESVKQFQIASDQPISDTPNFGTDHEHSFLRFNLMKEENREYMVGCHNQDVVEVLDSVIDQLYVLAGTINYHGLQDKVIQAFKLVHENNMTKVVDGKVLRNPDGKIIKPVGFVPVDLKQLF